MNKTNIVKKGLGFVGGLGASTIVGTICKVAEPPGAPTHIKVMHYMGRFGLCGAAYRVADKEIQTTVDELVEPFKKDDIPVVKIVNTQ